MISSELLDILRCPADVRNGPNAGMLDLYDAAGKPADHTTGVWLVCRDCSRKYPIKDDIPVMLIEEGDKFRNTPVEKLGAPT